MTPSATSSHLKGYQGQSPWLVRDFVLQLSLLSRTVAARTLLSARDAEGSTLATR